ncbi:MAG TPA: hypothetical protein VMD77_05580 [Candidatus Baltobacteraceae bacterium]|nr:hypothetical protein [Candidatus Baltobacteraceae bacterium]
MTTAELIDRIRTLAADARLSKLTGTITIAFSRGEVAAITRAETERFTATDGDPKIEKR